MARVFKNTDNFILKKKTPFKLALIFSLSLE